MQEKNRYKIDRHKCKFPVQDDLHNFLEYVLPALVSKVYMYMTRHRLTTGVFLCSAILQECQMRQMPGVS